MMPEQGRPVLYTVACGAPAAADCARAVEIAHRSGFAACVVPTPMGLSFLGDVAALERLTGYPVRADYKQPDDPDALPSADAFLVSPLTFNTLNKLGAGISDTLATGLLNEALGLRLPITAVPWINAPLAAHPAVEASMERLANAGVAFTSGLGHPSARFPRIAPTASAEYPWHEVEEHVARMRSAINADWADR